jgi:sporulation protein YlmC with PRC-barrel domain
MDTLICMKSKDLIGCKVENLRREDVGKIDEIVIDFDEGRVAYVVLSVGGFLGMGDKLFAVPIEAFRFRGAERTAVLDVDKEKLKKAPGFDKSNWPSFADRIWLVGVYDYYSIPQYWSGSSATLRR